MGKDFLYYPLAQSKEYMEIIQGIEDGRMPVSISGLEDSQKNYILSSIIRKKKVNSLIITYSEEQAKKIFNDMQFFLNSDVCLFPEKELTFYNIQAHSNEMIAQRLSVIKRIMEDDDLTVVASITSILPRLSPMEYYRRFMVVLEEGMEVDRDKLIETLINAGYERMDIVEGKGQFSVKGGIIDVFSLISENPFRIEFFDDEIYSIREFDVLSQRSINMLNSIHISPAKEILIPKGVMEKSADKIEKSLEKRLKGLEESGNNQIAELLYDRTTQAIEHLRKGIYFENIENFLPFYFEQKTTLLDFFDNSKDYLILDEPDRIREKSRLYAEQFYNDVKDQLNKGAILPEQSELICDYDELLIDFQNFGVISLSTLPKRYKDIKPLKVGSFVMRHIPSFQGKLSLLIDELKQMKDEGYRTLILSGTVKRGKNLCDSLNKNGIESFFMEKAEDISFMPGQIVVCTGSITKGFQFPAAGVGIISDREVFSIQKKRTFPRKQKDRKNFNIFTELSIGDYVVHETNGIGKYIGVKQLKVQGRTKDYLYIKYSGQDKLYVPTDQMHLIQKYVSEEGKTPRLSKLGSSEWAKTKSKVKKSIQEMAEQLLQLYAKRSTAKGYAFQKDTEWQKQFEDLFPYEETEDQLQAIQEVKQDMESYEPMDRLLCGDVGYGKTEVALRAAFKAVMDGKQVAVLVPTTVLAQQHFNTFCERFSMFPFNIEMMSRFKTQSEQREIVKQLKKGLVDVVIGTHRLLQSDIRYKDLGLLIIDEEQRFGVSHKEKIKEIRKNIDVLTLTATPIPRTLHMSLTGIRDMSIIESPPEDRYPVQTYVVEYDESLVKDAVMREINRGGQVFFVYNVVRSIERMASSLSKLLPDIKIAIAHGQMGERELERVMLEFSQNKYDLLVCTSIIENGLDLQNVNTIILYDADKFGLSQLYQLKGRVGRTNRLAYAYFTYRKDKILTEIAEKRLNAIKEFTEFGSGFKIAMRDLEIRGAGNILGAEQHGHIVSVGYDLYCKLLDQTVKQLKGEKIEEQVETNIDLDVDAYIDDNYIEDTRQKLEIYKKIASIESMEDKYEIEKEIKDRFGEIPEVTRNLIRISYIKAVAQNLDIQSITQDKKGFVLKFKSMDKLDKSVFARIANEYRRKLTFSATNPPYFTLKAGNAPVETLEEFMTTLDSV
ncbi:MAG: transcription-repair coupling factor [Clostridia bacterium]|nr:transcription-repair coupling factor [Clostridia bacterium]